MQFRRAIFLWDRTDAADTAEFSFSYDQIRWYRRCQLNRCSNGAKTTPITPK